MSNKVGYLGPKGTYSEYAARAMAGKGELSAYSCFPEIFRALRCGEIGSAVIPIENAVNGAVTQNLDLMQETEGVFAFASYDKKIDHRLITLKGCDLKDIKCIYSHPQALGQCAAYLARNFPEARLIPTSSTAESVEKISSRQDAAIAGAQCAREGYEVSPFNLSDEPDNSTTFLHIAIREPDASARSEKIFFSVTCRHEVGGLLKLLEVLCKHGINMTEIESRPIKDRHGEFRFFMEIEGDYSSPDIRKALAELKDKASSLKLLGCY